MKPRNNLFATALAILATLWLSSAQAAPAVPVDIEQPGTQPQEINALETPDKCDNCHGGYNTSVEPAFNWRGSMMANAGRDPIFWATLAVAEQDFDGVGDLCIRCHSTAGWLGGRSTPTDGSGLSATSDTDGVECDYCHKLTNPNNSEHLGVMFEPYVANEPAGTTTEGYYGSGMSSMWAGSEKLGPYSDPAARHQFMQSTFHRSRDFCGTCHDVSNALVGNFAHNRGTQTTADPVIADGQLGGIVDGKAAFNNPPYRYGIVERTFSEYKSGQVQETLVKNYNSLPADLKAGALKAVYESSLAAGKGGDYEDGSPRYFSCQTCHMRPTTGTGCNKAGAPVRKDLPLHDMTGGNYWMPGVIQHLDTQNKLRLGGGLTQLQKDALDAGALRAREQLDLAATLSVANNKVKIVNHTGHKLITGYPEGRRMWLNIKWYNSTGSLLREDGEYGPIDVQIDVDGDNTPDVTRVNTLTDLHDPNTRIYEAHYGMTKEWANQLINEGYPAGMPLTFDHFDGSLDESLGELAAEPDGTVHETFHFALNNTIIKDNRIPPYGMRYDEARKRNALPFPASQYGDPGPGGVFNYWDELALNPPTGSTYATIDLLYQPTSYEYQLFLLKANDRTNVFLADEGINMFQAWLATGMAEPHAMASATWGAPPEPCSAQAPTLLNATPGNGQASLSWSAVTNATYNLYYDQAGKGQLIAGNLTNTTHTDTGLTNGQSYCYKVTSRNDTCESEFSNILCAVPNNAGQARAGVSELLSGVYQKSGKGKTATTVFTATTSFIQGDAVILRATIVDGQTGLPIPNATADLRIAGLASATLTTGPSDGSGIAEASWQTQAPNRKGTGGTPTGSYTATITNVTAAGYTWDGIMTAASFTIQ